MTIVWLCTRLVFAANDLWVETRIGIFGMDVNQNSIDSSVKLDISNKAATTRLRHQWHLYSQRLVKGVIQGKPLPIPVAARRITEERTVPLRRSNIAAIQIVNRPSVIPLIKSKFMSIVPSFRIETQVESS